MINYTQVLICSELSETRTNNKLNKQLIKFNKFINNSDKSIKSLNY